MSNKENKENKNQIAIANNSTFAVGLIDTAKFAVIADKETKLYANKFASAFSTEDAAKGAQAYFMNQIHKRIASGETIENAKKLGDEKPIKTIADFAERYFNIGRSQAFNLSRAGAMLKIKLTDDGKIAYTDIFTNDFATKNFSNTVLIRFAEFIGDTNSKDQAEKQAAVGRLSYLNSLVKGKKITPDMSVSAIMKIVKTGDAGETTGTENGHKNGTENGTENGKGTKNGKSNATNKKSEKTIEFSLTEKNATDLKNEIIKAIGGKTKVYPVLARLAEELYKELNPSKK